MPEYTPNKNYALPYESEPVDIETLNENFRKDDAFPFVVASGTTTANRFSPGSTTSVAEKLTWYYKKWSDGTLEAYAVAHVTQMICNDMEKQDGTWRSKFFRFKYPDLGQKTIFHRSAMISGADDVSSGYWAEDVSAPGDGADNCTYQTIRAVSTIKETVARDKNIYVAFKGTWK